ncbi:PASTA domain-containing protein [Conexibacter sp. W3-3-2]|uniref:PASTA domain-containing protein n=1 Tax=Conexibacter sp. W3-3-2 TaxID=2675227 RepID=UPI0012B7E84B|nr:PASTA domain-containing protein [Conexibacter sp. W3-3-2]MTD43138.1 PASTA domain-containing protein [Conexibacter sp. W3-3-2]
MTEPTRVQPPPERRFSTLGLVLTGAAGFLVGILLVAALGGAKGRSTETVTVARTTTVTRTVPGPVTNGGTVIVTTAVPDVVGQPLDVARQRLERSGFDTDVEGGGLFGVIEESNWQVVAQSPQPGGQLEQGSTVQVAIERR